MKLKIAPKHHVSHWPGAISWVYFRFEDEDGHCIAFGSVRLRDLPQITGLMLPGDEDRK